jgi:ADP-heptose:LPS heptosyltransferase
MHILAIIPGGLSDQLLFFPTFTTLQRHYPQAKIDVVVEPKAQPAYRLSKIVHKVITFSFDNRNGPADWSNFLGQVREREYDIVITLEPNWTLGMMLWLTGIPKRVSYAGPRRQLWLTDTVPLQRKQYAAAQYHDLLQGLAIQAPCPALSLTIPSTAIAWVQTERSRLELGTDQPFLLLYSDLSDENTRGPSPYPLDSWQALIQGVQDRRPDLPIVLLNQAPSNQDWISALTTTHRDLKVSSPSTIEQSAALIAAAVQLICTDSTVMQLGVAVNTELVALFGPTNPEVLLPVSDRCTGLKSPTGNMAVIPPIQILGKIFKGE